MSLLRLVRIAVLLTILLIVAGNHWLGQSRLAGWEQPVWITLYPFNADDDEASRSYLAGLSVNAFADIGSFMAREAARYGRALERPVQLQLAPPPETAPPPPPRAGGRVAIAWWSLKMRWWAWRQGRRDGLPEADIQVFINYSQGRENVALDRSLGMQNGRYAVVNAFAARRQASRNRVVIAHELFHVLGATDKYDRASGQPLNPAGLAAPGQSPLYPQSRAEIMGGLIALSARESRMPSSLRECMVGPGTAREIGWLE